MRIGINVGGGTVESLVADVRAAASEGFATAWLSNIFALDAVTAAAVAGSQVDGIEIGTAVVPTPPRHPHALAQAAMTAHDAMGGGRFVLGIGVSHQIVIETLFGLSYARPAKQMEEYLDVLLALLHQGGASHQGEIYNVQAPLERARDDAPSVMVAALAPRMLALTGEKADGTITWMTGPKTIADHVAPSINAAAEKAGRPAPRVVCGLPVAVSADPDATRAQAAEEFATYGTLPAYQAVLEREDAGGPADVAIIGTEQEVTAAVAGLADAGVTDFNASVFGDEHTRTRALLSDLA